jgi:hypothetical protein
LQIADCRLQIEIADYCREIEAYLCRKNDGHLIRVVGPSFDLVSRWAAQGVPLKIAFSGIDRYVERYYRQGPRRRPVRIDFCEADVLEVFDEWRRALGLSRSVESSVESRQSSVASRQSSVSLPEHLTRVILRLTAARASGSGNPEWDDVIDRTARELDVAKESARGVRGLARQALIDRLAALDRDLLRTARISLTETSRVAFAREADEELAGFRASMPADAFARARESAIDRLVRERFRLPTITFL